VEKLKYWLRAVFFLGMILFCPVIALAEDGGVTGFGAMAGQIVQGPLTIVMNFMNDACYVAGVVLLLVGFNKYLRYRQNPQETPISTPIVYFILGVVVILLPFSYYLVQRVNA